jgi:hypothetical protein
MLPPTINFVLAGYILAGLMRKWKQQSVNYVQQSEKMVNKLCEKRQTKLLI